MCAWSGIHAKSASVGQPICDTSKRLLMGQCVLVIDWKETLQRKLVFRASLQSCMVYDVVLEKDLRYETDVLCTVCIDDRLERCFGHVNSSVLWFDVQIRETLSKLEKMLSAILQNNASRSGG